MTIKRVNIVILLLFCVTFAWSQNGKSCSNAIPLGDNYSAQILSTGTVWYKAGTFDLPIKVCFTPNDMSSSVAPEVEMDFSCQSGVYEDSILCSLFCPSAENGVAFDMPHKPLLEVEGNSYCITMGKTYRDLLLKMGIDYNVTVYVKVTYKSAGIIEMVPDTEFSDCMDGGKFMRLDDTIQVNANDKDRHVVLPYIQWRADSIRYIWNGSSPVIVAVANTCSIDPTDNSDERIVDWFEMQPGDTVSLTADTVRYYAEFENAQAGMYYGKFYSASPGEMKIERIPMAPPAGDAVLMNYGQIVVVPANDSNALYAILRDTIAVRFESPTEYVLRMYIGTSADFTPSTAIADYTYAVSEQGHILSLSKKEMEALWSQTDDQYLYVRFMTNARTGVTLSKWKPSDCAAKWNELQSGMTVPVKPISQGAVYYRLYYNSWKGGSIKVTSTVNQACPMFVGETCGFQNAATDSRVMYVQPISRKQTVTIPDTTIAQWSDRVDNEGNVYILFSTSSGTGTMTITSSKPAEQDPMPNRSTIWMKCAGENKLEVSVSENQTITILDDANNVVSTWSAEIGVAHQVNLADGSYVLTGKKEQSGISIWGSTLDIVSILSRYSLVHSSLENDSSLETGVTEKDATEITKESVLRVEPGNNYIHLSPSALPAMIYYMPDSAFSPIPEATIGQDTLERTGAFSDCHQYWQWNTNYNESGTTINIVSYEQNHILVRPFECNGVQVDTSAIVWDSISWRGQSYTESGEYTIAEPISPGCNNTYTLHLTVHHTSYKYEQEQACDSLEYEGTIYTKSGEYALDTTILSNGDREIRKLRLTIGQTYYTSSAVEVCKEYRSVSGKVFTESGVYQDTLPTYGSFCNTIVTLHLTVKNCMITDSIYFCPGENTAHVTQDGDTMRYYVSYVWESPDTWNYWEGAIVDGESERSLLNLHQVEQNLYRHYVGRLTPIANIDWFVRGKDDAEYMPLVLEDGIQWVAIGTVRMDVTFLCGEQFSGMLATSVPSTSVESHAQKIIENGHVYIIRKGVKYSLLGIKIE